MSKKYDDMTRGEKRLYTLQKQKERQKDLNEIIGDVGDYLIKVKSGEFCFDSDVEADNQFSSLPHKISRNVRNLIETIAGENNVKYSYTLYEDYPVVCGKSQNMKRRFHKFNLPKLDAQCVMETEMRQCGRDSFEETCNTLSVDFECRSTDPKYDIELNERNAFIFDKKTKWDDEFYS